MAITYHAGRRIQGISRTERQAGSGLTFSDDFSSDKGWETSNSTYMDYDSGNSRLKTHWYGGGAGANKTVVYDLGEGMVSDTKWILRMKINFGSTDGADNEGFIGLSDSDETAGKETAQDFAGVSFLAGYSTTAWNGFYECEADGAVLPPTSGNNAAYNFSDSTDYWLEIKRTSATGLTYTVYSDAFSTSLATQSVTIASTVSGLRYIKFANYPAAATDQPGAYVDDVQFYNDVTSTSTTPVPEVPASGDIKPTNVQLGSRFEETDTRKMYNYSERTKTVDENFDSTGLLTWTDSDSAKITVDSSTNERLDFTFVRDSTTDETHHDLGSALSNTAWVMDFDLTLSTVNQGGGTDGNLGYIGIFSATGQGTQDGMHLQIISRSDYTRFRATATYNSSMLSEAISEGTAFTTVTPSVTTYYVRIIRDGNDCTIEFYSSADRTGTPTESQTETQVSITGLQYISVRNLNFSAGNSSNNNLVGYIDNLKVYDGVTDTSNYWQEIGA